MSVNRNLYSNDLLIRSGQNIYLNGAHLTANADSFEIIRWIPHSLLVFATIRVCIVIPLVNYLAKRYP